MKWMLLLITPFVVGACGSSPAQSSDGGSDAAVPSDLASTDLYGCQDPPGQRPDGGACLTMVSGQVVGEANAPLDSILISVCGESCFYGRTAKDGNFVALIKDHIL